MINREKRYTGESKHKKCGIDTRSLAEGRFKYPTWLLLMSLAQIISMKTWIGIVCHMLKYCISPCTTGNIQNEPPKENFHLPNIL